MASQINLSKKKSNKLRALVILLAILSSSCFLVKLFSHQKKTSYARSTLTLPKLAEHKAENPVSDEPKWTIVRTRSGDTLASIFKEAGLNRQTLPAVLHENPHAKALANIKPNQEIQLLIHDGILEKLIAPLTSSQSLVTSLNDKHYQTEIQTRKMNSHNDYVTATVRGSLYGTAKRMNIPYKLIQQMTDIFNWEINFAKDVRAGDQFSIVYKAYYIDDKLINTGEIYAVTYTNRGKTHEAIRHVDASGDYDYYTPQGASLKKAFTRYPIKFSHISSSYNLSRYHPILHYRRPHKGVDLAAAIGTPVHATGDGRIAIIDRHNGYGNMVKVAHNQGYSSVYAHLLRFQKGLSRGDHVKRGQVIGYVGQTGLADGPHCHYEFHVNQQPKNPTTIELPHASPVPSREMASFKAQAHTLLAQLKLYEEATLAAAGKKALNTA